ncbi:hypothetical protein CERSUDRAFT_111788 [Gelatoporia subvermispora B]|uniref:Protein ROT1 n=1 Tax=Ceriporiopsis subvermispora (strain B) TaxID=914234 RepID=M2QQZ6_CERS8|nr:hypothetical protein CERSUDRAFT_111788 [Gelatoporia subvermispora B]
MILTSLLALFASTALAQQAVQQTTTTYFGTWSSGSGNVLTGPGFANPANESFTYPPTAGISYSFTEDGFYEVARYRFNSNGSMPHCVSASIVWHHGTYAVQPNTSIVLTPFGDGYQQVQDSCAAVTNFVQDYNNTELLSTWAVEQDPILGSRLFLFQFDGTPWPPMLFVSSTPNMLPTRSLRNITGPVVLAALSTNAGESVRSWGLGSLVSGAVAAGLASLLL